MGAVSAEPDRETEPHAQERDLRELMVRYQGGDSEAVDELVRVLSPRLLRFLSGPQWTRAEAEDLLQECWLRLHNSRHTYRSSEPLLPWVFAIARHTRLDGLRRQQRRSRRETLVAEVPEAPTPAASRAAQPDVLRLLNQLPPAQRDAVWMLKVSGMSLEEVARATGSSVGAIKQKAHRAYAALRELLREGA